MSLFHPKDHADNPPSTWDVVKVADRCWHLTDKDHRGCIASYKTKREAEAARESGVWVNLYEKEGRWYAGERVPMWREYRGYCEECGLPIQEAEHVRLETDIDFVEHRGHLIRRVMPYQTKGATQ